MEDGVVNVGGGEVEADEASDFAEPAGSAQSAGCVLDLSLERTEPRFNTPDKRFDDAAGRARRFGSARRFVSARRFGTPGKVPRAVRDYLNTVLSLSMSMVDGVVDAGGAEVEVDEASDYAEPAGSAQSAGVVDLSLELSAFEKQALNKPDEGFNDALRDVLNTICTLEAAGSAQLSSAPESDSTFEDAVSVHWQSIPVTDLLLARVVRRRAACDMVARCSILRTSREYDCSQPGAPCSTQEPSCMPTVPQSVPPRKFLCCVYGGRRSTWGPEVPLRRTCPTISLHTRLAR